MELKLDSSAREEGWAGLGIMDLWGVEEEAGKADRYVKVIILTDGSIPVY